MVAKSSKRVPRKKRAAVPRKAAKLVGFGQSVARELGKLVQKRAVLQQQLDEIDAELDIARQALGGAKPAHVNGNGKARVNGNGNARPATSSNGVRGKSGEVLAMIAAGKPRAALVEKFGVMTVGNAINYLTKGKRIARLGRGQYRALPVA